MPLKMFTYGLTEEDRAADWFTVPHAFGLDVVTRLLDEDGNEVNAEFTHDAKGTRVRPGSYRIAGKALHWKADRSQKARTLIVVCAKPWWDGEE